MTSALITTPLSGGGQTTLNAPITLASLYAQLKTSFQVILPSTPSGAFTTYGSLFDDQSSLGSGSQIIWTATGSTATRGTGYLRQYFTLSGTTLGFGQTLSETWSTTTHTTTAAAAGPATSFGSFNSNLPVNFNTVKHPELNLVLMDQGASALWVAGFLRPSFKNVWNENQCPFFFIPYDATFNSWVSANASIVPYSNYSSFAFCSTFSSLTKINPTSQTPDNFRGIPFLCNTGEGFPGYTSPDIAVAASTGRGRLVDTFTQSDGSVFTYISTSSSTCGLAVQTA